MDPLIDLQLSLLLLEFEEGLLQESNLAVTPQQHLDGDLVVPLTHLVNELKNEVDGFLVLGKLVRLILVSISSRELRRDYILFSG